MSLQRSGPRTQLLARMHVQERMPGFMPRLERGLQLRCYMTHP